MRIFSAALAAVLIAWAGAAAAQQRAAPAPPADGFAQTALVRGLGAYQAGRQDGAIAALNEVVAKGDPWARFVAEFYLARIYSENAGPAADHIKAFVLFRKLADENLTVDPETSRRAPFVAKALIALASYVRAGVKEIDLPPNPNRAADYLYHAAVYLGDRDAQFELARTYLGGDAPGADDVRRGLHFLSMLTEESHAPAQAMLADLFWRGRHVRKDDRRALALATLAVENAPAHERIWIEETYATVFCASTQVTRDAADGLAARWRRMFAQPAAMPAARVGLAARDLGPERQCGSGEKVAIGLPAAATAASGPAATSSVAKAASLAVSPPPPSLAPPMVAPAAGAPVAPMKGTAAAPAGFRAAGIVEAAAKK
jgi:TPR repeat protein